MLNNIFYMYSNMDGSSQILLFLIILVALMLVSITIINKITKKRNEKYDRFYNPINKYNRVMDREKKIKEEKHFEKEKVIPIEPINKLEDLDEEIEIMEDPEVIEVVSDDNSIEKISSLIEDNINNPKPIDLTKFEEEEELNAIISYDELVKKAGAKKIVYKTEKATISEPKIEEKIEVKDTNSNKFKASQVISPIYGIKKAIQKPVDEVEEFVDLQDLPVSNNKLSDEELQKDITFLTNLKTFRSNLD